MSKMAIAYAMKKKSKKMAEGGKVEPKPTPAPVQHDQAWADAFKKGAGFAKGGEVKGVNQGFTRDSGASHAGLKMRLSHGDKHNPVRGDNDKKFQNKMVNDAKMEHKKVLSEMKSMPNPKLKGLADGGEVEPEIYDPNMEPVDMNESTEHADDDLVMRIMRKRYSKGGMVANDTGCGQEAGKLPNQFDDLVLRDDLESDYDGVNAGDFLGNAQEDEDRKDIVARIMASRKKKDKLPSPA